MCLEIITFQGQVTSQKIRSMMFMYNAFVVWYVACAINDRYMFYQQAYHLFSKKPQQLFRRIIPWDL